MANQTVLVIYHVRKFRPKDALFITSLKPYSCLPELHSPEKYQQRFYVFIVIIGRHINT